MSTRESHKEEMEIHGRMDNNDMFCNLLRNVAFEVIGGGNERSMFIVDSANREGKVASFGMRRGVVVVYGHQ